MHAPFCKGAALPIPNGQSSAVAHGRPSSHSLRTVPSQAALAQSSSVPHGDPLAPRCRPALHSDGPPNHTGVHEQAPGQYEQRPPVHWFDAHSAFTLQRSPNSFAAGATQPFEDQNTGDVGSCRPHTSLPVHACVSSHWLQAAVTPNQSNVSGTSEQMPLAQLAWLLVSQYAPSGAGPAMIGVKPEQLC